MTSWARGWKYNRCPSGWSARIHTYGLLLRLVCVAACTEFILPGTAAAADTARPVPQPAIAAGVAAFPRLAPGGPETDAIDDALSAADARVRTASAECGAALAASQPGPGRHAWTRCVTVAMHGPRCLALVAEDDADCGGLYPNANRLALVYDLHTGRPANWSRLLPAGLVQKVSVQAGLDGTPIGLVDSPALKSLYLGAVQTAAAKVDARCMEDLRQMAGPFGLWPDARQGGLVVQPTGLPHAAAACGVPALLGRATLRRLGVQPVLLDAIAAARRSGL